MKPIVRMAAASPATDDPDPSSLLVFDPPNPTDLDLCNDIAEFTAIVEDMTVRDLRICARIILAVIEMNAKVGTASTNVALAKALRDVRCASMI